MNEHDKWSRRLQLLSLLSIFFIYKALESMAHNDTVGMSFWSAISIVYLISIIIALFVRKKSEKQLNLN